MKKKLSQRSWENPLIPGELLTDIPVLTLRGSRDLAVENHKGILTYGEDCIMVGCKNGILCIRGSDLCIASMNCKELCLRGRILSVSWE